MYVREHRKKDRLFKIKSVIIWTGYTFIGYNYHIITDGNEFENKQYADNQCP